MRLRVLLEEISSRSEFTDRETAVRSLRVVYADHSRLGHRGVAAGSVVAAQLEGLSWFVKPGRSEEKGWMLVADLILKCVKFPSWGHVSTPAGVAPEALEECLHSSKGYTRCPV